MSLSPLSPSLRLLRSLLLAAALLIFAQIVLGGVLRLTESGGACPDWPTCLGRWTPPPAGEMVQSAWLDYLHRAVSALAGLTVLAAAWIARRSYRAQPSLRPHMRSILALAGLFVIQVILGALVALELTPALLSSALHLGLSLGMLGLTVLPLARLFHTQPWLDLSVSSPFGRLSRLTFAALTLLWLSGWLVARSGAAAACAGWPVCLPSEPVGWLAFSHRLWVGLTALLVAALFGRAWRTQRSQPAVLVSAASLFVLFFAQALLGARLASQPPLYLLALHQATAAAAWTAAALTVIFVGLAQRTAQAEAGEASAFAARSFGVRGMALDLLLLTKPIVVALLLVTTYAGMVIGARAWPPADLVFWTLLGGFMAAGGSGAINQYIDRFDDARMQRTQKRPIPDGRLDPAEGLAFGVLMILASFYLLVAFVNLLAALLSLTGMVYYVLLYSLMLKKTTVQNIVIGGGAGAIPPLVGWAAATGSLNIPSLFLFAVIFMWTPPHFWALALVRRNDYARAGVPMLPVVRGEEETRRQIMIYTLELVVLTLLLPLFGLGGSVYLIGAGLLGLWLISAAYKVWKLGGNKLAWKMYRYSSMYLAFLFAVLMLDALV